MNRAIATLPGKLLSFLFVIIFFVPSYNVQASKRPNFNSYEEAVIWVRANNDLQKDTVNTSKSSWIRAAEYYTDGSGDGFLILNMKGKEYIWEGVPIEKWTGFKNADSFGEYYNQHIRGHYFMELEN